MIDQKFSKNINLFFSSDPSRRAALVEAQQLDNKLLHKREYENSYNYNCIILFERKFGTNDSIPFTLDLHGFKASSANHALKDFIRFIKKNNLPTFRIIFGKGLILIEVVKDYLNYIMLQDTEWSEGHVDVYLKGADYSVWPIINKKIRENHEESFFWNCSICKITLVVPKIPNKKIRSICSNCEAEYVIENNNVKIEKENLRCKSCRSNFMVPKTKKNLLITCPRCNHRQQKYESNAKNTFQFDTTKKHYNSKPSHYSYSSNEYNNYNSSGKHSQKYEFSSDHCFIATAVYQSRDSIPVVLLRIYRDKSLKSYFLGRLFVKVYYLIAPYFARCFTRNEFVTRSIRRLIDHFINKLLIGKIYGH